MVMIARPAQARFELSEVSDRELATRVYRHALCASSRLDPDEWFPAAPDEARAREQAARAIATCTRCPVRAECLELSLRHARDICAYGVWGGLTGGERRALRQRHNGPEKYGNAVSPGWAPDGR